MRVATAVNGLLRLPGGAVIDVSFSLEGVIVTVRLTRRRRVCSRCGQTGPGVRVHDRRGRRWRHLDVGSTRCVIECDAGWVWCPDCGAQPAALPWARAGSRYTREFEDTAAWLAQQMAKTQIARLLRIGRDSEDSITTSLTPHSLRRTFASLLIALGEDPTYVMQQMGHTTPNLTLSLYARAMRRRQADRDGDRRLFAELVGEHHRAAIDPSPGAAVSRRDVPAAA